MFYKWGFEVQRSGNLCVSQLHLVVLNNRAGTPNWAISYRAWALPHVPFLLKVWEGWMWSQVSNLLILSSRKTSWCHWWRQLNLTKLEKISRIFLIYNTNAGNINSPVSRKPRYKELQRENRGNYEKLKLLSEAMLGNHTLQWKRPLLL